jgi:hypothetical protein
LKYPLAWYLDDKLVKYVGHRGFPDLSATEQVTTSFEPVSSRLRR